MIIIIIGEDLGFRDIFECAISVCVVYLLYGVSTIYAG